MTVKLVDTHAHLVAEEFDHDRSHVIARARAAGVAAIVAVGITAESSEATVRWALAADGVFAAVGIHPNSSAVASPCDWDRVMALVGRPKVVALGETGLDRYREAAPLAVQQDFFDRHLRLSQHTGLPVVVHCRESETEILAMLREARRRGALAGVMHSFTGTAETATECVAMGLYISFAGMVTFKKAGALRAVAAAIPSERILVETDSPYLAPHPLRGKRNEPQNVLHTATCLAAARGEPLEEFARKTTANAQRLFGLQERMTE